MEQQKLGIALAGLGQYSEEQLAPALQQTKHCRLAGIVTGSREKAEKWKHKYSIPQQNIYNYENFDDIINNGDIDIVYVVLPNAMHAEYVIRAAKAGKHVITEKPMAVTIQQCEEMIAGCEQAGRLLSIGYRLHFEPNNLAVMELTKSGKYGKLKKIYAEHGFQIPDGVWRIDKKLSGGGPLMDVGIYCVQAAIYTAGEVPVAVTAKEGEKTDPQKFQSVEESLDWTMEFPSGAIAECKTSYSEVQNLLRAEYEDGWVELRPAYKYEGIKAFSSEGPLHFPQVNQQALQMDDFALCVKEDRKSKVPGEMGLRDVKIMMAIYEAMQTGRRIEIKN